jgi:thioredoxin reductase (NADPH)
MRQDPGVSTRGPAVDVLVIGAGPVGIACGIEAVRAGLTCRLVEKGALCNTLVGWPAETVFFSTSELLEVGGLPFVTSGPKPTRREGLRYYRKAAAAYRLDVRLYERVLGTLPGPDGFEVRTERGVHRARKVVAVTGFFDHANLLGVPGEDLPKVTHWYREAYPYSGTDVLVVGGGNSAVEAALDLYRNGARVTIAVREEALKASIKYWLLPDLENRVKEGAIRALFSAEVSRIDEGSVSLRRGEETLRVPNDFVVALTGYRPDFDFLRALGIGVTGGGDVVHDPATMETGVPGVYVAGVVAAGAEIGRLFIENGRRHAALVAGHVLASLGRERAVPADVPAVGRFQDGD